MPIYPEHPPYAGVWGDCDACHEKGWVVTHTGKCPSCSYGTPKPVSQACPPGQLGLFQAQPTSQEPGNKRRRRS